MSYRNISVDGKEYQYVIGTTHLKIKSVGLFRISEVGNNIKDTAKYVVTPTVIAALIRKQSVPIKLHCIKHNYQTIQLTYAPVINTETGKRAQMINCPECVADLEKVYMINTHSENN